VFGFSRATLQSEGVVHIRSNYSCNLPISISASDEKHTVLIRYTLAWGVQSTFWKRFYLAAARCHLHLRRLVSHEEWINFLLEVHSWICIWDYMFYCTKVVYCRMCSHISSLRSIVHTWDLRLWLQRRKRSLSVFCTSAPICTLVFC